MNDKIAYDKGIEYEWVSGRYEGGKATKIADLADASIGYIKLADTGRGKTREVIVAFRRPIDDATPSHLLRIDDRYKIEDLEAKNQKRMGTYKKQVE